MVQYWCYNKLVYKSMFQLLLNSACTESRTEGGDRARSTDLDWPKGYPIPYSVMLSNKPAGKEEVGDVLSDGVCLPNKPLHMMSFTFPFLLMGSRKWIPFFVLPMCKGMWFLFYLIICPYFNQHFYNFNLPDSLSYSGSYCLTELNHNRILDAEWLVQ